MLNLYKWGNRESCSMIFILCDFKLLIFSVVNLLKEFLRLYYCCVFGFRSFFVIFVYCGFYFVMFVFYDNFCSFILSWDEYIFKVWCCIKFMLGIF